MGTIIAVQKQKENQRSHYQVFLALEHAVGKVSRWHSWWGCSQIMHQMCKEANIKVSNLEYLYVDSEIDEAELVAVKFEVPNAIIPAYMHINHLEINELCDLEYMNQKGIIHRVNRYDQYTAKTAARIIYGRIRDKLTLQKMTDRLDRRSTRRQKST